MSFERILTVSLNCIKKPESFKLEKEIGIGLGCEKFVFWLDGGDLSYKSYPEKDVEVFEDGTRFKDFQNYFNRIFSCIIFTVYYYGSLSLRLRQH